jgi:hypothetical protein
MKVLHTIRLIKTDKETEGDFFERCQNKSVEVDYHKLSQGKDYCEITYYLNK